MRSKLVGVMVGAIMVGGCATTKEWAATGGSRADGTVRLSYEVSEFQIAVVNEEEGVALAAKRCKTWGYSGADAFGGTTQQCNLPGSLGGCARFLVTKEYQCTGTGTQ